jgi:trimethyllysine dioxygenase
LTKPAQRKFGFSFVSGVPYQSGEGTKTLLEKIAFIRETHYGGLYDFTADLSSKDTAYTSVALEAHTDTTYFSDPAGLQAFHLLSHTDGQGGASLLVDGFKVARDLLQQDPEAYQVLSTVNIHAHASGNEGISIQPYRGFPVLSHDPATGDLQQVRWNFADRASIELPISEVTKWYDAARKWDTLVKKKENEYWEQLTPGNVLIFDNWRVMHGRSAFTGKRRICGAYINRDDWISKYKILKFGQGDVLKSLPVG